MLKRKLENFLSEWKKEKGHKPLVIKGVRQCGKTFIAEEFARKNYAHVVYVNFVQTPKAAMAFDNSLEVDDIVMQLSTVVRDAEFVPGQTCIIFDEIQESPQARTALKFFHLDGRFDVIATGSLLGVKGYGKKSAGGGVERPRSIPVGYEEIVTMYPLDFEEFLWANGISEAVIKKLKKCFADETPIPDLIHQQMKELLLQYCIVGGMPEAVNAFIDTHNLSRVRRILLRIIDEYEDDLMDELSVLLLQSFNDSVRNQCSRVLLSFLLNYPMSNNRVEKLLAFLLKNLDYEEPSGRLALLHLLQNMLGAFPIEVIFIDNQSYY